MWSLRNKLLGISLLLFFGIQFTSFAQREIDPDAKILADVYHLFRGGSGFEGLKLVNGQAISIFHLNDFPGDIPRLNQQDKDRVFPGDGAAPMQALADTLRTKGGQIVLSLELFNPNYYAMDPAYVAKTGLEKMKRFF